MEYSSASLGRRTAWLVPVLVLVFTIGFSAAGLTAEKQPVERLPEIVRLLGYEVFFEHAVDALKNAVGTLKKDKSQSDLQKRVIAAWAPAADVAFAPEALRRAFLNEMEGKLSGDDLDQIFAFYKSPLGVLMNALETADGAKDILDPDAQKKNAWRLRVQLQDDPDRARILRLLERSMAVTESDNDLAVGTTRAMMIGIAAAAFDENTTALPAETIHAVDAEVDKMRLTTKSRMQAVLELAYRYRQASTSELRQYLAFVTTPAGKKLHSAADSAVNQAMIRAGGEFGQALMKARGKEKS